MVLKLVKKLTDPKLIKKLTDDVVQPVSKQTDEALEESFFKIKDDIALSDKKDYLTLNNDTYKTLRGIPDESLDKKSAEELFFSGEDNINTIRKNQSSFRKQEKAGNRPFKKEALQLEKEEITSKEFRKVAFEDVKNFESLDELNTFTEVVFSLDKNKRAKGIIGLDKTIPKNVKPIEAGDGVKARLDIPAYNEFDVYVPQITYKKPDVSGAESVFARTMVIENVTFPTPTKAAFNISRGIENKYPHATINGTVAANPTTKKMYTDKEAHNFAKEIFNDDSFAHLGYNPDRGGFFYDRKTKMPVFDSPLVIQIGKQIFAKKSSETAAERILKIRKMDLRKAVPKKKKAALFDTGGDVKRELVGTATEEKTKAGRTVYITDKDIKDKKGNTFIKKGSRVSEISRSIPIGNKWYNIPSIHAGKEYTEDELRKAIKENRLIPTSVHDSRKEAEAAAKKRSNELNKGGAMLNQQMKMAFMSEGGSFPDLTGDGKVTKKDILRGRGIEGFQEGGLRDEGGTVDPVSGNDVPSGSNKSEVRDDIPAMLSEGEFVFPADVVRYIGLSKLMEMRQEAKMGLKIMEEMGQMGNSEEATLPDDFGIPDIEIIEDDEDDDDDNDMDNMTESGKMMTMEKRAQGGVIEAQQGTAVPSNVNTIGNVVGQLAGFGGGTGTQLPTPPDGVKIPPQQTQFEQMMGYGAGQGSTRYNPRRVPYTKKDGTIVNVLEDYMGRPMEDIEGLTRVESYQAGPIFGGDTPAGGGGVDPVVPPTPPTPEDTTPKRKDRDAFYGKGADSTGRLTSMAEAKKQGKKLGDFSDAYEAQQARLDDPTRTGNLLEDFRTARSNIEERLENLPDELKDKGKSFKDGLRDLLTGKADVPDLGNQFGKLLSPKATSTDKEGNPIRTKKQREINIRGTKPSIREKRRDKKRREANKEAREKMAKEGKKLEKDGKVDRKAFEKAGGKYAIGGRAKGGLMKKDYP